MDLLGHESVGNGPERVIVLHDWMGDHRNYDPMVPYLDGRTFSYEFVDLRGYGLSRNLTGRYDLAEASADVLALATGLGWPRFHLVGHSMSSLVAQQVAVTAPDRVTSLVVLTPVGPAGMSAPEAVIESLEQVAIDEGARRVGLANQWGDRLSDQWLEFKLRRWSESARPEASRGYVRMFGATAVLGTPRSDLPVLAVIGDRDNEPFLELPVREALSVAYPRLELTVCPNVGHYPMQEAPVALATTIERFLRRPLALGHRSSPPPALRNP